MQKQRAHKRGFTLTELAIVLGVIGVIIGAIWVAASNTHEAQKENDAVNEAQTVVQNIVTLMTGQKFQTSGNDTQSMITAQTIPSSFVDVATPTTADNPWSGSGSFVVWTTALTNKFRLSFYNVPRKACLALLTQMTNCQVGQSTCPIAVWTNAAATGCQATQAGCTGTLGTSVGWTNLTTAQAYTLCDANSYTGGSNSVEFDFSP